MRFDLYEFDKEACKRIRLEKGITQVDMADATGMSQPEYSKYETGYRKPATMNRVAIIANALGVHVMELWKELKENAPVSVEQFKKGDWENNDDSRE